MTDEASGTRQALKFAIRVNKKGEEWGWGSKSNEGSDTISKSYDKGKGDIECPEWIINNKRLGKQWRN